MSEIKLHFCQTTLPLATTEYQEGKGLSQFASESVDSFCQEEHIVKTDHTILLRIWMI